MILFLTFVIFPLLIAGLALGGTFLGFYIFEVSNDPRHIVLPFVLATLGLGLGVLASFVITRKVVHVKDVD